MPAQVLTSVENNFTKGLITEFTGMNFPENAATDTDNCVYEIVGDVTRRLGIDKEVNGSTFTESRVNNALSDYKWNNAGGDGNTQLVVRQVGSDVLFYKSNASTTAAPLSTQKLSSVVNLIVFQATGGTFDSSLECQFADGNGYLFIYHPSCDPIYCTFAANTVTANAITLNIRDFTGLSDGLPVNTRPSSLSAEHSYNLINQGWVAAAPWSCNSSTNLTASVGVKVFTVPSGLSATSGNIVNCVETTFEFPGGVPQGPGTIIMTGTVTGYVGTSLTINITYVNPVWSGDPYNAWLLVPSNLGYMNTFLTATSTYPSNADVWWTFKNSSGVFDPATTIGNVTLNTTNAPRGKMILNAFNQQRGLVSGTVGLTDIKTLVRPRTGTWFQGRAWYAGVDAQQAATGDAGYYTWTENIYFSQTFVGNPNFGDCYQTNDPTSETLFDLLPTDGGVIVIQGSGSIYKLFPIQNGMLVFAANGIWFITGSQGIGFSANDYTITKISSVKSISGTSFVDVNGLPYFWNEEGIYAVMPSQQGGLEVNPITVGTILSFYNEIPVYCKQFVRGAYHPIDYVIQWVYRDTLPTDVTSRYSFNRILNYNTYNKAFYPFSVDNTQANINGILYVSSPSSTSAPPSFKYPASFNNNNLTYADEHDTSYRDWNTLVAGGFNYSSFFVTGYKLHGQAQRRFQIPYIYMYSRNDEPTSYKIQGLWNYAISGNSGKWSTLQLVNNFNPNFGVIFRRHRIRGQGLILQIKLQSTDGMPFDVIGWSTFEQQNMGV